MYKLTPTTNTIRRGTALQKVKKRADSNRVALDSTVYFKDSNQLKLEMHKKVKNERKGEKDGGGEAPVKSTLQSIRRKLSHQTKTELLFKVLFFGLH